MRLTQSLQSSSPTSQVLGLSTLLKQSCFYLVMSSSLLDPAFSGFISPLEELGFWLHTTHCICIWLFGGSEA